MITKAELMDQRDQARDIAARLESELAHLIDELGRCAGSDDPPMALTELLDSLPAVEATT